MQKREIKTMLSTMTGETDDATLLAYLDIAAQKIVGKCYPFSHDRCEVPERYLPNQLEIAAYLLNKRGAEGETVHKENGIDRTYEAASVPDSMLAGITPFCKVIGR